MPLRRRDWLVRAVTAVSAAAVTAGAFALVTVQYEVRMTYTEIERARQAGQRLADDALELGITLSREAAPPAVQERAAALGFRAPTVRGTVILETQAELLPASGAPGRPAHASR